MAVTLAVTLPGQPVTGINTYTPLGGDGWTAPHSVAEVSMSSPGDASAGNNTIQLTFDPRFTSIVSYVRLSNSGASAGLEMNMVLLPAEPRAPRVLKREPPRTSARRKPHSGSMVFHAVLS